MNGGVVGIGEYDSDTVFEYVCVTDPELHDDHDTVILFVTVVEYTAESVILNVNG